MLLSIMKKVIILKVRLLSSPRSRILDHFNNPGVIDCIQSDQTFQRGDDSIKVFIVRLEPRRTTIEKSF